MSVATADQTLKSSSREIGSWLTTGRFALLLLVFVVVMFPDVIFGAKTFFYRDFGVFGYPLAHYLRESIWHGEIPLWNPLNNGGVPFLAQWNTMSLYPPSLFFILLPLSWSLGVFCVAHLYLGGLGMYLLAHRWTGNRLAAAVAGFIYAFNGFTWFALVWPQIIAGLAWVPFVLWHVKCAAEQGGHRIVYAALFGALQMLTGAVEIILFTWIIAGALHLPAIIQTRPFRFQWLQAVRFAAVPLLVTGLAAAQLLPFLDLAAVSNRSGSANERWPLPLSGWANFLLPLFNTFKSYQEVYAQSGQSWTCSYYLGIATVAFALLALRRERRAWILWAAAVVACIFALGSRSYIYQFAREIFPALGSMRYPVKFVMMCVIVAPLLAALGVARLVEQRENARLRRALVLIASALCATVVALAWYGANNSQAGDVPLVSNALGRVVLLGAIVGATIFILGPLDQRREVVCVIGLLALLWLDNRTHVPRLNPTVTPDVYQPEMVREYLKLPDPPVHGRGRIMPSYEAYLDWLQRKVISPHDECLEHRLTFAGNLNVLDGFSKPDGFFALYPRETWEFAQMMNNGGQSKLSPLKDFVGAIYISAPTNFTAWTRRDSAMAMMTSGQRPVFADANHTIAALQSAGFNPRETVYLPLAAASLVPTNPGNARIISNSFSAHQVFIEVEAERPSLVTIAQSYYHRWHAIVDEAPATLLRANHAFQAVLVPAGSHRIILSYRDERFRIGAVISLLSLAACAGVLFWFRARRA
jgi:hypothetical protein